MRDIIFRGKRVDNKQWAYGYLQFKYTDIEQARIYNLIEDMCYDVIPDTVGQYTEINDVDGNSIYEGMTIHQKSVTFGSENIDIIGKVEFCDGSYWINDGENAVPLFNEDCENEIVKEY